MGLSERCVECVEAAEVHANGCPAAHAANLTAGGSACSSTFNSPYVVCIPCTPTARAAAQFAAGLGSAQSSWKAHPAMLVGLLTANLWEALAPSLRLECATALTYNPAYVPPN